MTTCKDCLHYEACKGTYYEIHEFGDFDEEGYANSKCDHFKDKSKNIEVPCKVGDKVAVRALCECIYTIPNNNECRYECPFEDVCDCDKCESNNERIFVTTIESIFNNGSGWFITFRHFSIEARVEDIGKSFFIGENAEQQAKEYEEKLKEREKNDNL